MKLQIVDVMLLSLMVSSHLRDLNNSKGCFQMEFLISYHCEGEKKRPLQSGCLFVVFVAAFCTYHFKL